MSTFLDKSRRNIETAKILLDNGFFIPSVHPAYYGAFLIAKCLLDNKKVMSFSEQEENKRKKILIILFKSSFPSIETIFARLYGGIYETETNEKKPIIRLRK